MIPITGDDLKLWISGGYVLSGAILNCFFALHIIALPSVILPLIRLHILALHEVSSNNSGGIETKFPKGPQEKAYAMQFVLYNTMLRNMVLLSLFLFILMEE